MTKRKFLTPFTVFLCLIDFACPLARADYIATGPMTGEECTLGIICSMKHVDAVMGADGHYYTVTQKFSDVTEYDGPFKGQYICHIRITSGLMGRLMSAISNKPVFYEKRADESYQKLDIEDLSFPCIKI